MRSRRMSDFETVARVGDIPEGTYRSVARYATQWQPRDKSMGSLSDELTLKTLIMGAP